MKITYQVQKAHVAQNARQRDYIDTAKGKAYVPDAATPFQIKAKIEKIHPGWYAAWWKREPGVLVGHGKPA